ncbi:hypothetical protein ACFSQD_08160 [Flavihumibacter stibioxidans]|nr:hypothetical protein [Flavihumibacter stibioxidans]
MSQKDVGRVTEIRMDIHYPVLPIDEDSIRNLYDTVWIQYCDSEILYFLPAYRIEEVDGEVKSFSRDSNYFFFHRDSAYGYFIKHLDSSAIPLKAKVDSILRIRGFHNEYTTRGLKYIETIRYAEKRFTEKYVYDGTNPNAYDSVFYSYDGSFNKLPYSFSLGLDSIRGAKMYKAQVIFKEKFHKNYNKVLPRVEYLFQYSGTDNSDPTTFNKVRDWLRKNGVDL